MTPVLMDIGWQHGNSCQAKIDWWAQKFPLAYIVSGILSKKKGDNFLSPFNQTQTTTMKCNLYT
jgi:hypothetical protein